MSGNAHQRRIARREAKRYWGESPSYEDLYASDGDPFDDGYDDEDYEDRTCENCHGTGGDPWNDGILPCEECDGEGRKWWL